MQFNHKKMRDIRENVLKISRLQLALCSGLSQSYIEKLESGSRKSPSYISTIKLAKALEVEPAELFL